MQITIILLVEDLNADYGLQKCQAETLEPLIPKKILSTKKRDEIS